MPTEESRFGRLVTTLIAIVGTALALASALWGYWRPELGSELVVGGWLLLAWSLLGIEIGRRLAAAAALTIIFLLSRLASLYLIDSFPELGLDLPAPLLVCTLAISGLLLLEGRSSLRIELPFLLLGAWLASRHPGTALAQSLEIAVGVILIIMGLAVWIWAIQMTWWKAAAAAMALATAQLAATLLLGSALMISPAPTVDVDAPDITAKDPFGSPLP